MPQAALVQNSRPVTFGRSEIGMHPNSALLLQPDGEKHDIRKMCPWANNV